MLGWTICCLSLTEINGKQAIILSRMQPHKESALMKNDIDADRISVGFLDKLSSKLLNIYIYARKPFDN